MFALIGWNWLEFAFNEMINIDQPLAAIVDHIKGCANRFFINPEFSLSRRAIPFATSGLGNKFHNDQRRDRFFPQYIGATHFAF